MKDVNVSLKECLFSHVANALCDHIKEYATRALLITSAQGTILWHVCSKSKQHQNLHIFEPHISKQVQTRDRGDGWAVPLCV